MLALATFEHRGSVLGPLVLVLVTSEHRDSVLGPSVLDLVTSEHGDPVLGPSVLVLVTSEHRDSVLGPSVLIWAIFEHRGNVTRRGGQGGMVGRAAWREGRHGGPAGWAGGVGRAELAAVAALQHGPVDDLPELLQLGGAAVLEVEVVGVLPDVEGEYGLEAFGDGVAGAGLLGDGESAVRRGGEPDPAGAEQSDALGDELVLEGVEGAPLFHDLEQEG